MGVFKSHLEAQFRDGSKDPVVVRGHQGVRAEGLVVRVYGVGLETLHDEAQEEEEEEKENLQGQVKTAPPSAGL